MLFASAVADVVLEINQLIYQMIYEGVLIDS